MQSLAESSYSIVDDSKNPVKNKLLGSNYSAAINRNRGDGRPVGWYGLVTSRIPTGGFSSGSITSARYYFDLSGFVVEFLTYTEIYLKEQGLREELIRSILYVQAQGCINNSAVQQLCKVSKATATRYLFELEKKKYLHKAGITGAGTGYTLQGPGMGSRLVWYGTSFRSEF